MPLDSGRMENSTYCLFDDSWRFITTLLPVCQNGADDYVVKPFDLAVLYSRILALLRRTKTVTDTKLFCDDLMLDKEKTAIYDGQKEIVVSQPEYRILLILMENKGKTITRNQLLEQVWDRQRELCK